MTAALAGKLEQLLTENVYVKEKIGMLESIVQDLTKDLGDKRIEIKKLQENVGKSSMHAPAGVESLKASTKVEAPNFNLGTVGNVSTPESRRRQSTMADAIDEI